MTTRPTRRRCRNFESCAPPPGQDKLTADELAGVREAAADEGLALDAAGTGRRGPGQAGSARTFPGESASRAAGFGTGMAWDVMPGCAQLAVAADAALDGGGAGDSFGGVADHELVGLVCAFDRAEAYMAARKLVAIAEVFRRNPEDGFEAAPGRMPAVVHEFTRDQLALALGESRAAADWLLTVAWHLATRLGGTLDALAGGIITRAKAELIVRLTQYLDGDEARAAEAKILGRAGRLTPGGLRSALARAVMHDRAGWRRSPPGAAGPAWPAARPRASSPSRVSPDDQLGLGPGDHPQASASSVPPSRGGQVPRHRQQPVRRGPGLAQRQGQLVPGELAPRRASARGAASNRPRGSGGTPPRWRPACGGHVRLGPVEGAYQPDQLMIGHPAEDVTRTAAVQRGVGGHRQLRAAGITSHATMPVPNPAAGSTSPGKVRAKKPPAPPRPPRAGASRAEPLIGRRLADPGELVRGQLVLPGGGVRCGSSGRRVGEAVPSWAHSRSSHASRSAACHRVAPARRDHRPARDPRAGTEGMDHIRSGRSILFEHDAYLTPDYQYHC